MIEITDIQTAAEHIAPYINHTPLLRVPALDRLCNCMIYLKPENMQLTGSFKLRGATNKILNLSADEQAKGVVAASSGNHAQGVAYAAARLGIKATIVMPENAPPTKIAGTRSFNANIILCGLLSGQREAKASEIAAREGCVEVHPFNDPLVIAGQGTAALEILADEPDLDILVAPVGGGGLISGLATAAKALRPDIRMIGVEPDSVSRYRLSRLSGSPQTIIMGTTIADGTRANVASPHNFPIIEKFVDELYGVTEDHIKKALYHYAKWAKLVVEPSGSLPLAALLAGLIPVKPTDKVCLLISGGNLDLWQYSEWLKEAESNI